ncbi:MAG: PD40 domain-containing protein, partial [Cyclobacteriaceae bacterium]|nr:PD40 domain-containing protein [Cyclobacteriaceae bacterium HetDA_MAG_MS6]
MRLSTLFSTPILTIVSWYLVAQPLVMSPSLSPDGSQVAFSYQGDIWTVSSEGGRAIRLTLHEGYDANPFWDATGNMIAFQSDRYGNNDIYTIPAKGGVPNRLTYHSENDLVCSWSADNEILFSTQRIYSQVEWEPEVYRINANGGTPDRYMNTLASEAVESPDGQWIALVRGVCRTSREAYRGPANRNIWLYNKKTDKYLQVTDFAGNDFSPKWGDDNTLYYLTSKSGRYNVHKLTLSPSKSISAEEQVTTETESGLISFSISRNGQKLVYHQANRIQLQDLQSGAKNAIDIEVQGDYRHDPVERKTVANKVEGYAISPNGEYMAYTIRGDIFVTKNDKEDSRSVRITDHVARDWQVTWASDSSLIFISDREGQYDLYHAKSADPKESDLFKTLKLTTTRMTSTSEQEFLPILAPNGKQVAYR